MNILRKLVGAALALAIALFALPGLAQQPQKQFSASFNPSLVGTGTVTGMQIRVRNETPNGNSSINSMRFTLPAGWTMSGTPTSTWTGTISATATSFTITNMSPLKPQQTFFVALPALTVASTGCTQAWAVQAWTGSSLGGDTFARLTGLAYPAGYADTIGVPSTATLAFGPLPTSFVQGDPYSIQVTASTNCGPASATVTLADTPSTATADLAATRTGSSVVFPVTFAQLGTVTLTASAAGFTPVSRTFTVYDGNLECRPLVPFEFDASVGGATDVNQTGYAKGERGQYNKDGSICVPVNYTFTNNVVGSATPLVDANGNQVPPNGVSFVWDTAAQAGASFKYTVTWRPEWVDAVTGLPSRQTRICTGASPTPCTTTAVAKACLASSLPAPYGALSAAITSGDTTIAVTTTATPPAVPFPIVVGNERMLVTAVAPGTWTVTRGNGGTTPAAQAAGKSVMSTPLPLSNAGAVMPACVAEENWVSVPAGSADCSLPDAVPNGPRGCVLPSTTIIDIGDPIVLRG